MGWLVVGAALLFTVTSAALVLARGANPARTISLQVAETIPTATVFGVATTASSALMGVYAFGYLPGRTAFSPVFYLLAAVLIVALAMVGWFPHRPRTRAVHLACAWALMATAPLFAIDLPIEWGRSAPLAANLVDAAFLAYAAILIVLLVTRRAWTDAHMLFVEASYTGFFFLTLSVYAVA
jgi:hypothetical protein